MNLEELRARLGPTSPPAPMEPARGGRPLERCVAGTVIAGPAGEVFVVDNVRGPDQSHGPHRFDGLDGFRPRRLEWVVRKSRAVQGPAEEPPGENLRLDLASEKVAFIDTETTGLGYGAGTQVFMVGVGHRDGGVFRVRQFFLRHPGEEPALLSALAEYLRPFETVVSFNGRSFDWPLLENRFILRRISISPAEPLHLDLLHVSRRLWKVRLESCGLGTIEDQVLGVRRSGEDVEGWMIPQLYFQYVRSGNASPLRRVFYHNLQDILSLAMLAVHIERLLEDPWGGLVQDPADFFSLGRMHRVLGEHETAARLYAHALELGLPPHLEPLATLGLALVEKRRRQWIAAVELFQRVLAAGPFERIACVELAKYHEHVARDFQQALKMTNRAINCLDRPSVTAWPGIRGLELHHRRRRLNRRLSHKTAHRHSSGVARA